MVMFLLPILKRVRMADNLTLPVNMAMPVGQSVPKHH